MPTLDWIGKDKVINHHRCDNLMYGEPNGDDFDKMVGEIRKTMLIMPV